MDAPLPPRIDELQSDARYRCIETLNHDDLPGEVRRIFKWRSMLTLGYVLLNLVSFALAGWFVASSTLPFGDAISHVGLGFFVGFLALLPLHESIHAIAYRLIGASGIAVHYRLRTLTAYCVADRCVVSGRAFAVVCLAPLIVVTLMLLAGIVWVPSLGGVLSGMLVLHTAAATGDLALANFVWQRRANPIWTYDDSAEKRTYFYVQDHCGG